MPDELLPDLDNLPPPTRLRVWVVVDTRDGFCRKCLARSREEAKLRVVQAAKLPLHIIGKLKAVKTAAPLPPSWSRQVDLDAVNERRGADEPGG